MNPTIKFLDLYQQYTEIQPEIDEAIAAVIRDSAFIGGFYLKTFEREFAEYIGTRHCLGVGNGTDALEIAIEALELPAGSEIIVPANSFIATSEAVTRLGHKVIFCAADPATYTIDTAALRAHVTVKTKAVIVVHLFGHPCDMAEIETIAREFDLRVIEDCAQAHGAEFKGRRVGTFGDIACFSFYPGKNLGAFGDGGAILTGNDAIAERCQMIANHGRKAKYDHEFEGRNSRLDGLQAAILSVKLRHLDAWTEQRIAIAKAYNNALLGVRGIRLPQTAAWARHVYHLFVIRSLRRDALQKHLSSLNIQTGVHYPIALPALAAYRHLRQATASDNLHGELLSLPMGGHLTAADVRAIADAIKVFHEN